MKRVACAGISGTGWAGLQAGNEVCRLLTFPYRAPAPLVASNLRGHMPLSGCVASREPLALAPRSPLYGEEKSHEPRFAQFGRRLHRHAAHARCDGVFGECELS